MKSIKNTFTCCSAVTSCKKDINKFKAGKDERRISSSGLSYFYTFLKPTYKLFIFLFISSFFVLSCQSSRKSSGNKQRINYLQDQEEVTEQLVKERIFYKTDSTLDLYINLYLSQLPQSEKTGKTDILQKEENFTLRYLILKDDKNRLILDSSVITFKADLDSKSYYQYQFRDIAITQKEFLLRIELYNFNRRLRYTFTKWYNLNIPQGKEDFLLKHLPDSEIYLNNYATRKDSFIVSYRKKSPQKLFLLYSFLPGKAAPPPFFESNSLDKTPVFITDSISNFSNGGKLNFFHTGRYIIKADTLQKEGLFINCFNNGFPYFIQPQDYAEPLIYITSRNEFINLQKSSDKRLESYNFWYSILNSTRRGGLAADAYYKRVMQANESFTSSKEGWKTDRGMIYIIFGKPDIVFKDRSGENWVYNENNFFPGAKFIFNRVSEPWGDEYFLVRNENLRNIWYIAVDAWRRGRLRL